ncbi:F/Y-rich N-terminus family protein [Histomonas meleagridis]|uniref:F/Y-rich N-terminus family protein n=1 Tax=Histomonas meleagridis TaxID=135588 RepID=UPI00355A4577|nr:F/Y-rich N-terminus family protein [Histomonas meleagridis]KAH0802632.1 F/Y-rich N-terminus family protein [Histomonas meleagridis]
MLQGLDESFVLIKDMVRESNNEDADNYRQFMNQSVFAKSNFHDLIHDKSYELLQRLEVLHYIERAMSLSGNNMDKLQIGRIVGKKPSENWNEEYDKLLVIAAYKYGFGVYDFLSEDKDKRFMELFMNGKIQHQMLNERLLKIGESLKRINVSFIQKVDDSYPSEDENFEFDEEFDDDNQFSRSEKSRIFKYLVRFGIDNYEKMRNDIGLNSKPLENLKEYVEAFMQKCENGTMPHVTAVRVKTRVESMNRLRSILQLGIEFFKRAPRWRQLPQSWNSSIEFSFFQEIKNRGITAMNEIAQLDTFKTIDFPAFIFKTKSIMLRIKSLYEFSQKNWVSSKPSKPRPPVTENPSQKDAHLIAKVLNGDVKYPFKISSSSYILDIGTIVTDRPLFHTQTYIYPAGYKSTRLFSSLDDPTERVTYLSEIIDNGTETPRFRVTQEGTDHVFEGDTPTAPWAKILKKFTEKNAKKGKSISGPDAFLLKSPVTISLIQQQPGIEELENYQMKKYNLNPSHNKKKKSRAKVFEYELSDETSTSSSESEEEAENEK